MKSRRKRLGVEAVFLDLDGTVVDSRGAYLEALKVAFAKFGRTLFDVSAVFEVPKRLEQGIAVDDLVQGLDVERFLDVYLETFYNVTCVKSKPFSGVDRAVEKLHARVKLGLITLRCVPRSRVVEELDRFGLMEFFDLVVTAFDGWRPKPWPDVFVRCAADLGVKVGECVVVGDSVVDVRAGKNAGAKTVAVLSGIYSCAELQAEKPDLILENVGLLPDFLDLLAK